MNILLCQYMICCLFFFFKQKTAYEMRISDWSSDVCSSDLPSIGSRGGAIWQRFRRISPRRQDRSPIAGRDLRRPPAGPDAGSSHNRLSHNRLRFASDSPPPLGRFPSPLSLEWKSTRLYSSNQYASRMPSSALKKQMTHTHHACM